MTVSSTTANRTQKTGNGVWTTITINWPMFQNSDSTYAIQVVRTTIATGATSTLAETTDYTVALDGTSPNTGTITLVAGAPSSAYRYTVIPNLSQKQEVDLQNAVQVDMPTIEGALDKLTLLLQAQEEKLSRAVLLDEDTVTTNIVLPSFSVADANKIVAINATGDGMTTIDADELVSVSSFDINSLTADASPVGNTDYVPTYDASASTQKKVLLDNLPVNISGKTELTSGQIDTSSDMLLVYDSSAGVNKKVSPSNLGVGNSATHGAVQQIQYVTKSDTQSISCSSGMAFQEVTGLSINFTPSRADSKILIGGWVNVSGSSTVLGGIRVAVDGVSVTNFSDGYLSGSGYHEYLNATNNNAYAEAPLCLPFFLIIDSWKSLDQKAISVQAKSNNSITMYINRTGTDTNSATFSRQASHLWAMEILQNENTTTPYSEIFNKYHRTVYTTANLPATNSPLAYTLPQGLLVSPITTNSHNLIIGSVTASPGSAAETCSNILKGTSSLVSPTSPSNKSTIMSSTPTSHANSMVCYVESTASLDSFVYTQVLRDACGGAGSTTRVINKNDGSTTLTTASNPVSTSYLFNLNFSTSASNSTFKQVVQTTVSAASSGSVTETSYFDPALDVSITPTSSSNYLMCILNVNSGHDTTTARYENRLKLRRDGSDIIIGDAATSRQRTTAGGYVTANTSMVNYPLIFMLPATSTSATTIDCVLGINQSGSATNVYINRSHTDTDTAAFTRGVSQLTVIEIDPIA